METFQAIRERHSTRSFSNRPLEKKVLESLVDAGRLAPSGRNEQPWEFIIVTHRGTLKIIGGLADHGGFIADAAACIIVLCRDSKYYLEDGSAATQNILLAATDLGIQSCWVAGDKKAYAAEIASRLGVPQGYRLVSLIALGYEDEPTPRKSHRPLKEVLHWEQW